jgi:hypothetical protein
MNENFETIDWTSVYGKRHPVTTGLTWGYYGGQWSGFAVTAGTLALTNNTTNYIVVSRVTGAISVSTSTTNWNDPGTYARVYRLTTSGGAVITTEDFRSGFGGLFAGSTLGRHEVPIMASGMTPRFTDGCDPIATVEISANQPNVVTLDFSSSTQQHAQFSILMPPSWNQGTVSFVPAWSHGAGASSFGVVWQLRGVSLVDGSTLGQNFGTAQTSTDTGGTADRIYFGPESAAITISMGSPFSGRMVVFEIARVTANGSDTLDVKARLHGIALIIETDAENDE